MKIYFYNYLFLLVSLFILSGCEEEERYGSQGAFSISLVDDLTGMVVTKSTPSELGAPLASQFKLQIKNTQTGALSYEGLCNKTYYEVPAATYDLFANYGENPILAFDSPYYKGELANQAVDVSGKNVVIPCSVGNALVSVKYVNQSVFDAVFISYGIVATVGDLSLNWPSEHAQKSVYFRAGSSVSFVFKGILKAGSKEITFPLKQDLPETYKAKDHYTLRLTYQAGQSKLDITTEKKEATINQTVPQDWLPKPSTESADFTDKVLTMKETMNPNAIINLKVARPLQDLKFKLELGDPNFQSLNKEYILSALSEQDKVALEQAGIILPAIGTSEPIVNISGLTSKLQTINGGQTVNNYISINPKANNRWNADEGEAGEKYTIQVEKPEFKVEVYPGNIWTKEFTATVSVQAGNPEVLVPDLKYEYSLDGNTWLDTSDKNTFQGLTPDNIYKVRVTYRDIVSESKEVQTYSEIQLENAGLEQFSILRGSDDAGFFKPKDYGAQYEWISWATLNSLTAGYSWKTAYSFNSRSGTRPTTDKPATSIGKNAVRVITLAHGGGGTDAEPKYFVHSEFFLGTYIEDGNKKNYGISFKTHPTGVKFQYKCISNKNNDLSEVKIQMYSDEILLGEAIFQTAATDSYSEKILSINYNKVPEYLLLIPNKLSLVFKSGVKENLTKDDLKQFGNGITNSQEDPMWRGNELFIDDISLLYER